MKTSWVLATVAAILAAGGLLGTFVPQETASYVAGKETPENVLGLQLLGALYLGFAMMNWMAKGSRIGGIYNRPLAMGNFLHFFVGGMALVKSTHLTGSTTMMVVTGVYVVFAVVFGIILFRPGVFESPE